MNGRGLAVALGVSVLLHGCTKKQSESDESERQAGEASAVEKDDAELGEQAGQGEEPAGSGSAAGPVGRSLEREVELLDEPRERRIHPDEATASTFLWNDWNRFKENYHPNYLVDDDPKTAWVEGAKGPGQGEWVELRTTPVRATTRVRLRLRNGYHKSKSLFDKNGRAKKVTVRLLPSKVEKSFELADSMNWAELEVEQPEGILERIRLTVDDVYPGTRYQDLCLSDLEIFVTARNIENPEFEKSKLEQIKAWKRERVATAKFFASKEAKASPFRAGYRAQEGGKIEDSSRAPEGQLQRAAHMVELAGKHMPGPAGHYDRAKKGLSAGFAGWTNVRLAPKMSKKIPALDGVFVPDAYELYSMWTSRPEMVAPIPGLVALYNTAWLATFDAAKPVSIDDVLAAEAPGCSVKDQARYYYFQPPQGGPGRRTITDLLVVACGKAAERDGYYGFGFAQLLQYADDGRLLALYDLGSVTLLDWSPDAKLNGGKRLHDAGSWLRPSTIAVRGQ